MNSQFSGFSIRMPFPKTGQQCVGPGLRGSVLLFWTKSNHDLSLGHVEFEVLSKVHPKTEAEWAFTICECGTQKSIIN